MIDRILRRSGRGHLAPTSVEEERSLAADGREEILSVWRGVEGFGRIELDQSTPFRIGRNQNDGGAQPTPPAMLRSDSRPQLFAPADSSPAMCTRPEPSPPYST